MKKVLKVLPIVLAVFMVAALAGCKTEGGPSTVTPPATTYWSVSATLGGTHAGDGTIAIDPPLPTTGANAGKVADGTEITVTVTVDSSNDDVEFKGWTGAGKPDAGDIIDGTLTGELSTHTPVIKFKVKKNIVIIGNISDQDLTFRSLTIAIAPTDGGKVTVNGADYTGVLNELADGEEIALVATPETGYTFVNWTATVTDGAVPTFKEEATAADASVKFDIDADYSLTANFLEKEPEYFKVTAVLATEFEGKGTIEITGTAKGDDGEDASLFEEDTEVTVAVTITDDDYKFGTWTAIEDTELPTFTTGTASTAEIKFTVSADVSLEAALALIPYFDITVDIDTDDVTATLSEPPTFTIVPAAFEDSENTDNPNIGKWKEGTVVTLTAVIPTAIETDCEFDFWEGFLPADAEKADPEAVGTILAQFQSIKFTVAADVELTAVFMDKDAEHTVLHDLNVTVQPQGGVDVTIFSETHAAPLNDEFRAGTLVKLEAKPNLYYKFSTWMLNSGETLPTFTTGTATDPVVEFLLDDDYDISPSFEIIKYTLTITTAGEAGSVTVGGDAYTEPKIIDAGTTVALAATPTTPAANKFKDWTATEPDGALPAFTAPGTDTSAVVSFVMTADFSLTATFIVIPTYTLTITVDPAASGSVTVDGEEYTAPLQIKEGAEVVLDATPVTGWEFVNWTTDDEGGLPQSIEDETDTTAQRTFEMKAAYTIQANFEEAYTYFTPAGTIADWKTRIDYQPANVFGVDRQPVVDAEDGTNTMEVKWYVTNDANWGDNFLNQNGTIDPSIAATAATYDGVYFEVKVPASNFTGASKFMNFVFLLRMNDAGGAAWRFGGAGTGDNNAIAVNTTGDWQIVKAPFSANPEKKTQWGQDFVGGVPYGDTIAQWLSTDTPSRTSVDVWIQPVRNNAKQGTASDPLVIYMRNIGFYKGDGNSKADRLIVWKF